MSHKGLLGAPSARLVDMAPPPPSTESDLLMDPAMQENLIVLCAIISILFGLFNVWKVLSVKVHSYGRGGDIELQDTGTGQTSDEAVEH